MTINTSAIADLLRPGLHAVTGDYPSYPTQWSEIYEVFHSDKGFETEVEMKMLGLAQLRAEGAATAMDDMSEAYTSTYLHRYVALGFVITHQSLQDCLYKTRFPQQAKALAKALAQTKELMGASVLCRAFDPTELGGDGQPLCSDSHPLVSGGTLSNVLDTPTAFAETSLEEAIVKIQQFKDHAGLTTMVQPKKLIVPPQLQWAACRILESAFRTNTANNDISAIYNKNAVPQGYRVNQFLTDPKAAFLLTDAPDGLKHFIRMKPESDTYADFATDNLMAKMVERYSFGYTNYRSVFGLQGA